MPASDVAGRMWTSGSSGNWSDSIGASSYTAAMLFTSRYALQRHGPKRLVVRRTRTWDEVVVRVDAVEIVRTNKAALRDGVEHRLYDHSVLPLWIEPGPPDTILPMVTRNGP